MLNQDQKMMLSSPLAETDKRTTFSARNVPSRKWAKTLTAAVVIFCLLEVGLQHLELEKISLHRVDNDPVITVVSRDVSGSDLVKEVPLVLPAIRGAAQTLNDNSTLVLPFQEFPYPKTCQFEQPPPGLGTEYEIALFYHVGMLKNWRNIVRDQLHTLDVCGLGHMSSSLVISFANGPSSNEIVEILNDFSFARELDISFVQATAEPWESDILSVISRTCRKVSCSTNNEQGGKRTIVYYFHNKGASRWHADWRDRYDEHWTYSRVLYWRKYLEWFSLERPTLCLRAILNHGASTCGVSLFHEPSMHYSGNFWTASCEHISTLPANVMAIPDAWDHVYAEMWIGLSIPKSATFVDHVKYVELFESKCLNSKQPDLYEYLLVPEMYAYINETYTQGQESSIWLDYLAGLEGRNDYMRPRPPSLEVKPFSACLDNEFPYPTQCQFEQPPPGIGTSYEINLFYHVSVINNWDNIVRDQLRTLDICGLGHMASSLTISYHSNSRNVSMLKSILQEFNFTRNIDVSFIEVTEAPWQGAAIASMARTCRAATIDATTRRTVVYFFENKGADGYQMDWRDKVDEAWTYSRVLYWRKYMEWFLIERPTLCLRAILNHGASTCGVNLRSYPSWHYSGNFWSASCEYIATLPPTVAPTPDAWETLYGETWIGISMNTKSADYEKHVALFDSRDHNSFESDLFEFLIVPEIYAYINETKTQGRESGIWLDYLTGLEQSRK